jgi:hypothetical protein
MNQFLKQNQKHFSAADVARTFQKNMVWENDHFGHCTFPCARDGRPECEAICLFSGKLNVICVNEHCIHQGRYSVPSSILNTIADKWNEDAGKAQTKENRA